MKKLVKTICRNIHKLPAKLVWLFSWKGANMRDMKNTVLMQK